MFQRPRLLNFVPSGSSSCFFSQAAFTFIEQSIVDTYGVSAFIETRIVDSYGVSNLLKQEYIFVPFQKRLQVVHEGKVAMSGIRYRLVATTIVNQSIDVIDLLQLPLPINQQKLQTHCNYHCQSISRSFRLVTNTIKQSINRRYRRVATTIVNLSIEVIDSLQLPLSFNQQKIQTRCNYH